MEDEKSTRKMMWESVEKSPNSREKSPLEKFQDMLEDRRAEARTHILIEKALKMGRISGREELSTMGGDEKDDLYEDEGLGDYAKKRISDIQEAMSKIAKIDNSKLVDTAVWRVRGLSRPERLFAAVSLADSRVDYKYKDSEITSESFFARQKRDLTTQMDGYFQQGLEDQNPPNNEQE